MVNSHTILISPFPRITLFSYLLSENFLPCNYITTMHSSAFFRTSKPAIRVVTAAQNPLFLRSIFTKSNASDENPTVFGSGFVIAASTIALYYISSSSHHISYADSGQDIGKKSTFLFGGNIYIFFFHFPKIFHFFTFTVLIFFFFDFQIHTGKKFSSSMRNG